jgi:hypothetical protein
MTVATRWSLAIVTGLLLAGCASVPSAPGVMALPGSAKSADEFRSDDASCRQAAAIDATATKKWRYDMTYLECMYARGNQIPVPNGMFAPTVSPGPSPPVPTSAPATGPAPAAAPRKPPAQ